MIHVTTLSLVQSVGIISEQRLGRDVEGSGRGLISDKTPAFA